MKEPSNLEVFLNPVVYYIYKMDQKLQREEEQKKILAARSALRELNWTDESMQKYHDRLLEIDKNHSKLERS